MGVRMNVAYDNGAVRLAPGQEYHRFPKTTEGKLIRTGLAEYAEPTDVEDIRRLAGLDEADDEPVPSMALTKAQLIEMAIERGVEVEETDTKAALIGKIEAAG